MLKSFPNNNRSIHFKMLGIASGGFNPRYSSDPARVRHNLTELGKSFGSTSSTLMLPQCHSTIVEVGPGIDQASGDAFFTTALNHALLLRPADCIPLVLYDDRKPLLALVHGSRQGLEEGIIEKCLKLFTAHGSNKSDLHAYIGPSIQKDSYVLPVSIKDHLVHGSWRGNLLAVDKQHIAVNISGFTRDELLRLGLAAHNISRSTVDTATDKSYYSHYRATRLNEQNGRNGVAISQTA